MPRSSSFNRQVSLPPAPVSGDQPLTGVTALPTESPLDRTLSGGDDLATLDLLGDVFQLGLQAGWHLGVPRGLERREYRPAVGNRADVRAAVEIAVCRAQHGRL